MFNFYNPTIAGIISGVLSVTWADILLSTHTAVFLSITWSCVCRLIKSNRSTCELVRTSFWLAACASTILTIAPWGSFLWPDLMDPYKPSGPVVAFGAAILAILAVSLRGWANGVPDFYQVKS